jgi:MFS family permease
MAVIAGPLLGWWAQRAGPRPMQMTGLIAVVLGTAGLVSAPLKWTLIPCFASQGIGLAAALIGTNLWAAIGSVREERALALAVGGYMFRIAAFTTPVLLGWLFDRSSTTMIVGGTALCVVVSALITWRSTRSSVLPLAEA